LGPKMAKHGRLVNVPMSSKRVPNGQHNMFGAFQTKLDFLLQTILAKKHFVFLRQKIDFCLKWSKMVQMGPNGPRPFKVPGPAPFGSDKDFEADMKCQE